MNLISVFFACECSIPIRSDEAGLVLQAAEAATAAQAMVPSPLRGNIAAIRSCTGGEASPLPTVSTLSGRNDGVVDFVTQKQEREKAEVNLIDFGPQEQEEAESVALAQARGWGGGSEVLLT